MTRARNAAGVIALFALLTVIMTWPIASHAADRAVKHQDVYFNMWRMEWVAHALRTPAARLFDANIFYPERRTLAFSDAMLLEGVVAAPLYWSGMRPVLVHNVMLLGAIVLCGAAMFALARHLTGSRGAGLIAGIVFAFAPYRFEHIMHMELQWAMWSPLALLFLHRTLETGTWRHGAATGACVALQLLSSIYYGIFLATFMVVAAVLLIASDRRFPFPRVVRALALGAAITLVAAAVYARPYARTHAKVGDRSTADVAAFSASPSSYLTAPAGNRLYGAELSRRRSNPERQLFPGIAAVLLAVAGLLLRRPATRTIVYVLLLALAFDMSLGLDGISFRLLYEHVAVFRSLRAPARLGLFVLLFLSVLAAHGYSVLVRGWSVRARRTVLAAIALILLAEYSTRVNIVQYPNAAPELYRLLRQYPLGVVAEFPVPHIDRLPGDDAEYAYLSTFHWYPLVNGYSGNYPASYLSRLESLREFPDDRSFRQLRLDGVRYVIVHTAGYSPPDLDALRRALVGAGTVELGTFESGYGPAILYVVRGS